VNEKGGRRNPKSSSREYGHSKEDFFSHLPKLKNSPAESGH